MNSNKKSNDKLIQIYSLIEFVIFCVSVILNVMGHNLAGEIILLVAIAFSVLFAFLFPLDKTYRIMLLGFYAFIFLFELFNTLSLFNVSPIFLSLALFILVLKLVIDNWNNKRIVFIFLSIFLVLAIGLMFLYKLFEGGYIYLALDSASIITGFSLGLYSFTHSPKEKKPNCFFILAGLFFFFIFRLSIVLNSHLNLNELMTGLFDLINFSFFLPAALFSGISFIKFDVYGLDR